VAAFAIAGLVWGVAEATVFFIVPDVLLTFAAIFGKRPAWVAVAAALVGALAGGAAMYTWENRWPGEAATVVAKTPGAMPELFDRAERGLRKGGAGAMLVGGVSFLPFKVYAVSAPLAGMSLPVFLVCAAAARGARFAGATLLARWLVTGPLKGWGRRRQMLLHLGVWGAIYGVYFGLVVR
jgi:membrane protein YqaA with SNARE-associated domain